MNIREQATLNGLARLFRLAFVKAPRLLGLELQCKRVDTIARSLRAGAIIEDVAEVRVAPFAADLRAQHAVAAIFEQAHACQFFGMRKTRPAAMRFKFCVGGKERRSASPAEIAPLGVNGEQGARKRSLRTGFAQNVVALGPKLGAPLALAFEDLRDFTLAHTFENNA